MHIGGVSTAKLPRPLLPVIEHEFFQALGGKKQLGLCNEVYLGAEHSRKTHSIGTGHRVAQCLKMLDEQLTWTTTADSKLGPVGDYIRLNDKDRICIIFAGLCHDLGHAPFSHRFEGFMHAAGHEWSHEDASQELVKIMFNEVKDEICEMYRDESGGRRIQLGEFDLLFVQQLINPPQKKWLREKLKDGELTAEAWSKCIKSRPVCYSWCFELVSNWRGGMDLDRLDYFVRDAYALGIACPADAERFLNELRIVAHENKPFPCSASFHVAGSRDGVSQSAASGLLPASQDSIRSRSQPHAPAQRAAPDPPFLLTLASPSKDFQAHQNWFWRWRKEMYEIAYQHPTVAVFEECLERAMLTLKECRDVIDYAQLKPTFRPMLFAKLTDGWILSTLLQPDTNYISYRYFQYTVLLRKKMLEIGSWKMDNFPAKSKNRDGEEQEIDIFKMDRKKREDAIRELQEFLVHYMTTKDFTSEEQKLPLEKELHPDDFVFGGFCNILVAVEEFHCGNKERDPCELLIYYDLRHEEALSTPSSGDFKFIEQQLRVCFDAPKVCSGCDGDFRMSRTTRGGTFFEMKRAPEASRYFLGKPRPGAPAPGPCLCKYDAKAGRAEYHKLKPKYTDGEMEKIRNRLNAGVEEYRKLKNFPAVEGGSRRARRSLAPKGTLQKVIL
eukprot:g13750.t1